MGSEHTDVLRNGNISCYVRDRLPVSKCHPKNFSVYWVQEPVLIDTVSNNYGGIS